MFTLVTVAAAEVDTAEGFDRTILSITWCKQKVKGSVDSSKLIDWKYGVLVSHHTYQTIYNQNDRRVQEEDVTCYEA